MADLERKLAHFANIVLGEANRQKEEIIKDVEEKKTAAVREREIEILSDAYEDIQKCVSKYSKENNAHLTELEAQLKKEIIEKRKKIIDAVFKKAMEEINRFIESEEYEPWLADTAKKAMQRAGGGTIFLDKKDMKYKEKMEKLFPDCSIEADSDIIGGVIVRNDRVSADYSIKQKIEEEKMSFLKTSGLSID